MTPRLSLRRSFPGRRPLAGTALALLALAAGGATPVAAQFSPTGDPAITVTGAGEASAPAETARVQFAVDQGDPFGGGFGAPPSIPEDAEDPAEGTPEAGEADVAVEPPGDEPGAFAEMAPGAPEPLTEEDLQPIVEAMVDAGVAEDAIEVNVSPGATGGGPYGTSGGLIQATVEQPEAEQVADVVAAATDAATEAGLSVRHAGVEYDLADCSALVREARQAAIDDGRAQAEELADLLGVTLGDVVQLSDYGFFGPIPPDEEGCPPAPSNISYGPFETIDTPPFDPNAEAEASAYANLNMSFAYEVAEA